MPVHARVGGGPCNGLTAQVKIATYRACSGDCCLDCDRFSATHRSFISTVAYRTSWGLKAELTRSADAYAESRAGRVDRKRHAEIVKLRRFRTKLQDQFDVLEMIPKISAHGLACAWKSLCQVWIQGPLSLAEIFPRFGAADEVSQRSTKNLRQWNTKHKRD